MKNLLRTAALLVATGLPLIAPAATPQSGSAATPEAAPVAALDAGLLATMQAGSAGQSFAARYAALDPVVKQTYNLPMVVQNSVGFSWPTLPAAQQQQLSALFEQFTVVSYVSQFTSAGAKFVLLPKEKSLGANKIVETKIVPGDGSAPTELDYVVAGGPSNWQITDVLLNGTISQVAVHASDFSGLVSGGDAAPLIAALKTKITTLSNGAITPRGP
jgi:phospholipid transport system substrate-binding protein